MSTSVFRLTQADTFLEICSNVRYPVMRTWTRNEQVG